MTAQQAAAFLQQRDDFLILTHRHPDGDTLGSAFALCLGLQSMGKRARVAIVGALPQKYAYMQRDLITQEFDPQTICSVDVADRVLLGEENNKRYGARVDLSIDHHGTSRLFAAQTFCADCAATVMPIRQVLALLGVALTPCIADCLYTGLCTDTGCFRYSNTTEEVFLLAAELLRAGADTATINRLMFETKSRATIFLEQQAMQTLHFACNGKVAVMTVTQQMMQQCGAQDSDMDGLAALPRQIEGVWVGITLRQTPDGAYKASVRTCEQVDASAICALLGGGGHIRASGCTVCGPAETAEQTLLQTVMQSVPEIAL